MKQPYPGPLDGCSEQTREATARSHVAAADRAAVILGLCQECWGDMLPGAGGVLQCVDPECPDGPNGGLEP